MADQIHKAIQRNHRNATRRSVLDDARIPYETYQDIFKDFWEPSDTLSRAADRIRSSSLDISSNEDEHTTNAQVIQEIESETGVDIPGLVRSIRLLTESLDEKIQKVSCIESELEDAEKMIQDYNTRISRLSTDLNMIGSYLQDPLCGQESFISNLRESFLTEVVRKDIYTKLQEHEMLVSQIRQIRPVIRALVVKENISTCKICMENAIVFTVDPCGHCYCEECSSRMLANSRCYQCRRPVQKLIKIFLN